MSAKFTYYYPENAGYAHCRILGAGSQGTATLVRSVQNGNLFVRKKAWSDVQEGENKLCGDVEFNRQHDHIPQLVHSESFIDRDSTPAVKLNTMLFPFANVGDLITLYDRFGHSPANVPEVLVWRCFSHLLKTIAFLHFDCNIKHNDLMPGNVLVHFANDEQFPKFLVTDFGVSEYLSTDADDRMDQIQEELGEVRITISFLIGGSMHPVERGIIEKNYSPQFLEVYDVLRELLKPSFKLSTYQAQMENLRSMVDHGLELLQETSKVELSFLRPGDESLKAATYDSKEELLRAPLLPPGPWQVATIDQEGSVLAVDPQMHQKKRCWALEQSKK